MARRGRVDPEQRSRARATSVVVPFPRASEDGQLALGRLIPSARTLLTACAIAVVAILCLLAARETSLFAVRSIEVVGAPGWVDRQVTAALADHRGESLVALDLSAVARQVEALPTVAGASFDRAYPHTLRIQVTPERPVAVVRQGASSYVVSQRGRVIARVDRRTKRALARIWVAKDVALEPGAMVDEGLLGAVRAVTPLAGTRFPSRVTSVRTGPESLTLRLASGLELRLGDPTDIGLKLAVAARVIPRLMVGSRYLDVSVPERPVGGTTDYQPKLEVDSSTSTTP